MTSTQERGLAELWCEKVAHCKHIKKCHSFCSDKQYALRRIICSKEYLDDESLEEEQNWIKNEKAKVKAEDYRKKAYLKFNESKNWG
jgi:hypothetical protein